MRCRDVMKPNVVQCRESDSVHRGAFLMKSWRVGFLPVADRDDRVVGVVTDRDLVLRVLADERPTSTPIRAVMSKEPVVCRPDEELWLAEEKMVESRKSRLPVVDADGRCVGVISLSDLGQIEPRPRAGELLQRIAGRESPRQVRH
jgi:CBS domain-containing protein